MRIEFLQPHTHGGIEYLPGNEAEVDDASAAWIVEQGVGREIKASSKAKASRPEAAPTGNESRPEAAPTENEEKPQ